MDQMANIISSSPSLTLFVAITLGFIPVLLWLFFWLHEDKHPEPKSRLALTFIGGMVAVGLALVLEAAVTPFIASMTITILVWAFIEEVLKYGAARFLALKTEVMDEPIDAFIYLTTAALGFAALENTLFFLSPLGDGMLLSTITTGNLRFIGAVVLHTLASGALGAIIGLSYYRSKKLRRRAVFIGLSVATIIHWLFNWLILSTASDLLPIFSLVWLGILVLIAVLEKVKRLRRRRISN